MRRPVRSRPAIGAVALTLAAACGGEKSAASNEDSGTAEDSAAGLPGCAGEPVVTWANFGQGFLREQCQACHASTSPDRGEIPADVIFDTAADAARLAPRIAARALGEAPTMPPEGGVSDADRALLAIWLQCDPAMQQEER